MSWMLKNSDGKKDAMLTFAVTAFLVVTFNVIMATISTLQIGGYTMHFEPMEAATMTAYLASTLTAYAARRYTDKKYPKDGDAE